MLKKMLIIARSLLVFGLILFLFACSNTEEIFDEESIKVSNGDFRTVDESLDTLKDEDSASYQMLLEEIYDYVDIEVNQMVNEKEFLQAIDFLEDLSESVNHIPYDEFASKIVELQRLEQEKSFQQIYESEQVKIANGDFRTINESLATLHGDILYERLMDNVYAYINVELGMYIEEESYLDGIDFLVDATEKINHIPYNEFSSDIDELYQLEATKVYNEMIIEAELEIANLESAGDYLDALVKLRALEIEELNGQSKTAYEYRLFSLLVADMYTYFWDASSIADLDYVEETLEIAYEYFSDSEFAFYVTDLLELQWHHSNFEFAGVFLNQVVLDLDEDLYLDLLIENDQMSSRSYEYGPREMASFLDSKSVIVLVYNEENLIATGSAFFINSSGLLLTNNHVVEDATSVVVELMDGSRYRGDILLTDPVRDLALIDASVEESDYVLLGNSYYAQSGETVFTYGSPLGVTNTITEGIISKNSSIINNLEYIQLSAPISPGSSGGMLVDKYGYVIGVTTATLIDGQNMNLAIPINRAINFINEFDSSILIHAKGNRFQPTITNDTIERIHVYSFTEDYAHFMGFLDVNSSMIYGRIDIDDDTFYKGEFENGVFSGLGQYHSGDYTYFGEFLAGEESGYGIQEWDSGDFYIGYMVSGQRQGQGQYYWYEDEGTVFGHAYIGEFEEGIRNGIGTYYFPNGNIYEGEWVHGNREGYGTHYWPNGDTYVGEWLNGYRSGQGVFYWSDGEVYDGDFVEGVRTGHGLYYWTNGDRYDGDFVEGRMTGQGTYYWSEGASHAGGWLDSVPHGEGTRVYENGDYFEADWSGWDTATGKYYWASGGWEYSTLVDGVWQ